MDTVRRDLRFAIRLLIKDKAFAATTILTLALCIGANTAIFAVVRSVLLRPLPYPQSDRLVYSYDSFPGAGVERAGTSVPNYIDRLALTDVLESQALYRFSGIRVGQGASAEGVDAMNVTPSFFHVLETRAARGRLFREEEGQPGHDHVALVSYGFAQRQPAGLDGVVGRDLRLDNKMYTVVGVLPQDFTFLNPDVKIWTPLAFTDQQRSEEQRYSQNHEGIGRLAAHATLAQAQSRIDALNAQLVDRAVTLKSALINAGYRTRLVSLEADVVRNVHAILNLLWGGVLFVLLIAAVNITNLSLVRASGRLRELATRYALGAARNRVTRLLITESVLLTSIGGALGLALGAWCLGALSWIGLSDLPRSHEIRIDALVVAFTIGVAGALGVVIGAVPGLQLAGLNLGTVLRDEGRGGTTGRSTRRVRRGLVIAQVALAFILLIGAGLLLASFRQLLRVDPGFSAEHVLTGRVSPLEAAYPNDAALRSYTSRALAGIRSLPGVVSAGATSFLPFSWDNDSGVIVPEGYVMAPGESVVAPSMQSITAGYLETMRVSLQRGRFFTESDTADAPKVVIVDERLAKKFWPKTEPIGRRMYLPKRPEDIVKPGPDVTWMRVVGIAGTVKLRGLIEGEDARSGAFYVPYSQNVFRATAFAIRTTGDPAQMTSAVRHVLAGLDPELQMFDVFTMPERVDKSLNPRRTPMLLSLAFGVVALLLASVGIYGVLAYQVTQRTREIGIRMALGSNPARILGLILREGGVLVVLGLAGGLGGAIALRRLITSQLYGVGPFDPSVMLTVTGVLALASLVACLGPARRAARVDPMVALTHQ
jgi:predicted permease